MPDIEAERFARAYYDEEHLRLRSTVNTPWENLPECTREWRTASARRVLDSLGAVTEQRLSIHGEHRMLRPHEVGKPIGQRLKDAGATVESRTVLDWRDVEGEF